MILDDKMVIGKTNKFVWDYSERSDILNIHQENRPIQGGEELGDFTIDFDAEGNVVGLEIMNVTDFLQEAQISPEQLSSLCGAELLIKQGKGGLTYIWIKLVFPQEIERVIPVPAPVLQEGIAV